MDTMRKIKIEKDIKVIFIQAKTFSDGILEAFQKLHTLLEFPPHNEENLAFQDLKTGKLPTEWLRKNEQEAIYKNTG
ncbi:hypothetical protein QWT87_21020 [Chryseobacterium sp. APV1]|uniref:Uncharacterized protein n=1 Tax=Chryseobacterium urinae TaxID=3058400 RepID=A0ABT8U8H7_9FLAO|nr:hypothetical protein [Chryseobacterium sp. APV1]MDO3427362.1 hypothetical protein [Chryseobacterium sp. APV1]